VARQRSILGLDIGTFSVKAVELSGVGDNLAVTGVGWEKIPGPEYVEDTIHAVIANNNLRARRVVTSVSGRSVIVRLVNTQDLPDAELRQAVRYEADKYIPFDVDDVQIDAQRLGAAAGEGGQIQVLLVAAKRQLIEEHITLLQSVGLSPAVIDVDLFALANAFEFCNRHGELGSEGDGIALVDVGASKTTITITRGMENCFTREVYTAGNALTDAVARRFGADPGEVELMKEDPGEARHGMEEAMMPVLEDLGSEIRLSFDYYENQFEQTVNRVYLSGGTIRFPGLVEALGQILEVEARRFTPFESLDVRATDDVILRERASDMVVALGLASRLRGM
jgi:type IV pilus assembly protein PilM